MKKVMITTAALALAFGLSPFAGAADANTVNGSNNTSTQTSTKTDTDTKTITKTNTDSKNSGQATAPGLNGAAANNHSTATTNLSLSLTNAFNKSTVVNATKLDGYVSGNSISHIGNYGGAASYGGNGGRGGDGGYATARAHSGKAYSCVRGAGLRRRSGGARCR